MISLQNPLCTSENLDCISNIKVDNSDCVPKCSGILVTSYEQRDAEEKLTNVEKRMIEYMSNKVLYLEKMANEFQGSYL